GWALDTYRVLVDLAHDPRSGVSMVELRQYSRTGKLQTPDWAIPLGASSLAAARCAAPFKSGFVIEVPLMDTTIYLDYLIDRFRAAGGEIKVGVHFEKLEDLDRE